ncbi:DNA-3-methyladenine glycosylase [hydrothermal vent metagenome]|uniref:DNA-3-methyladenine glycosylase n=1 Tax=hydrothermal vent metagenome TaxID=652676 RepID=A0A3B0YIW3_9ZZZZ
MKQRCVWANSNPLEIEYHDHEWGVPVYDDRLLFEMLTLESAQSGLKWVTVLQKRQSYLKAFDNFEPSKVSQFSDKKIEALNNNAEIVRNKLKIKATIENAKYFLIVQNEFENFSSYLWSFVNNEPINNAYRLASEIPTSSIEAEAMSEDMKKRGFKFVGPTTCYAYMQAVGLINDHLLSCYRHTEVQNFQSCAS